MATYTSNFSSFESGLAQGFASSGVKFGVGLCPSCGVDSESAVQQRFDAIASIGKGVFRELDMWAYSSTGWDAYWPRLEAWLSSPYPRAFFAKDNRFFASDGTTPAAPVVLRSGSVHYSRIVPELWEDRLARLSSLGQNAITTYVPWNFHQTVRGGAYDFSSPWRNIAEFIRLAQRKGFYVILRAGPYMCGEWEFGGLPAYLFENGSVPIRTYASPYIDFVTDYWTALLSMIKAEKLLFEDGGPVVMVQVENEYGSYGDVTKNPSDKLYIEHLVKIARSALGDTVMLFTTDGGNAGSMSRGSLNGSAVVTIGDGCGNPDDTWAAQKQFNVEGQSPFLCGEFYPGWLTHWNDSHPANTSTSSVIAGLNSQLAAANGSGSVNLYMAHGGTSFGYAAGANGNGGKSYQSDIPSYDYNAPVSESGDHGIGLLGKDKFAAIQAAFRVSAGGSALPPEPPLPPRAGAGSIPIQSYALLFDNLEVLTARTVDDVDLSKGVETFGPECYYGFVAYDTELSLSPGSASLSIPDVRDRAQVWVNGEYIGATFRAQPQTLTFTSTGSTKIRILLENMGRINFSHGMDDERKGIVKGITINGKTVSGKWTARCLDLSVKTFANVAWKSHSNAKPSKEPMLFKGAVASDVVGKDFFLSDSGFTKGVAWVGDFNLGRFWSTMGPQHTLYVPGPIVKASTELVVLDLEPSAASPQNAFALAATRLWSPST